VRHWKTEQKICTTAIIAEKYKYEDTQHKEPCKILIFLEFVQKAFSVQNVTRSKRIT